MTFVVEEPGSGSSLQDRGRPGNGHLGVSPSGAFDRDALRQVNALLGNAPGAAALETYGGLVLRAEQLHVVAVTGGVGPVLLDGRPVPHGRAVPIAAGQRLVVGPATTGLRTYVGVTGGLVGRAELGSYAFDSLGGLGTPPPETGQVLVVGAAGTVPALDDVPPLIRSGGVDVDVVLGPRDDWFTDEALARLTEQEWTVTPQSNRIGLRLEGAVPLDRAVTDELDSEATVSGALQIPPDGQPVLFMADHPVTGGYPVVACVVGDQLDRAAQVPIGARVRFRAVPGPALTGRAAAAAAAASSPGAEADDTAPVGPPAAVPERGDEA